MSLEQALTNLNKKYGAGSVFAIGATANICLERTSSGSVTLDFAMGGGLPVGRISNTSDLNHLAKPLWLCLLWLMFKRKDVKLLLLMQNMH